MGGYFVEYAAMNIDAQGFHQIASTIFAPVYPVIADQIIAQTGITSGTCLDAGCGSGLLGVALAKKTNLFLYLLDTSPAMLQLASQVVRDNDLRSRTCLLPGEVGSIALPDGSVNLVISRGSLFFWDDLPQAFREIYRVLAPGGRTYIGGGFGSKTLRETIRQQMVLRNPSRDFSGKMQRNLGPKMHITIEKALQSADIGTSSIIQNEEAGLRVMIRKPEQPGVPS